MKTPKTIKFTKMSGAGNDFIVIEDENLLLSPELVRQLCDRHNGIGADGVLEISKSQTASFKLRYFNSDGSEGFLCLNGSRCAVMYAFQKILLKTTEVEFEYLGKIFKANVIDESNVKVIISPPKKVKLDFQFTFHSLKIKAHYVDLGSEHLVIFWDENTQIFAELNTSLTNLDVPKIGKGIRWLPEFAPNGINVNFVKVKSKNELEIRT
ncbi:MAG: diaminopimelate epimerase, partial [Ignavibacteria bacterium]|nr:diaminopimelate epimerase [Ignavibacteria bacterium]